MAQKTNEELKTFFETGDVPTQAQFADFIDTAVPCKKYVALLTQTGTAAPIATILENTIGDIVWSRVEAGFYNGTLNGAFTIDKVLCFMVIGVNGGNTTIRFSRLNNNAVQIFVGGDNDIKSATTEIRVYP